MMMLIKIGALLELQIFLGNSLERFPVKELLLLPFTKSPDIHGRSSGPHAMTNEKKLHLYLFEGLFEAQIWLATQAGCSF